MSTIVVPVDFSVSDDRAVQRAVMLARSTDAGLTLIHVETDPDSDKYAEATAARGASLEELAISTSTREGVACDWVLRTGNLGDEVTLLAEQRSANLIVAGRHERGLRDLVASAGTEQIARRTTVPILIANSRALGPYAHILLGTRLDEQSAELARWLIADPLWGSPNVSALFVHDPHGPLPMLRNADLSPGTRYADDELALAQQALDAFLLKNGLTQRVHAEARLRRMPVSLELEDYATGQRCDLVAIAGSKKPFLERLVTGSVAREVLRDVEKDILIYPSSQPH